MTPIKVTRRDLAGLVLAAMSMFYAASAAAQAGTGNLAGWSRLGDVGSTGGVLNLSTAGLDETLLFSSINASDYQALAAEAGVSDTAFDLPGFVDVAYEGALAHQSFSVLAGQTLSFQWSFGTEESTYEDHAFAIIDGQVLTLATRNNPGLPGQTFSHTFSASGTTTFALGIVDTGDWGGVSTLAVQNLSVAAVPEPETVAMLLAGLGVVGWASRRQRKQAAAS